MKEYGGYIELDTYRGQEYYPELLALNSGRGALRFLIRLRRIRKLYLPAFCCDTVREACEREGISWEYYSIDARFRPLFGRELGEGEWLYVANLYGVISQEEMEDLAGRFGRVIGDYTHSFFLPPLKGGDTLYSCRKFFGVADGAYLALGSGILLSGEGNLRALEQEKLNVLALGQEMLGSASSRQEKLSPATLVLAEAEKAYASLEEDKSYERMHFLLGRYEGQASDFYREYAENNEIFSREPVKRMSRLTHNLLRAIDYEEVKERRSENFAFLSRELGAGNRLELPIVAGAYAYPFWPKGEGICGGELRRELIRRKVYIPVLWPEVLTLCGEESLEHRMAENILPLPVDQRYGEKEMGEILEILFSVMRTGA